MENHNTISKQTLLMFTLMNFVLAMSAVLFNGILDQVAYQLQIPVAKTGLLNSSYAYGAGFGVPITLIIFRKMERTLVLKGMLLATILASFWLITTNSFLGLLLARFLTGVTSNSYGVLAMGTVALLTPPEKLGATFAKLFMGSSLALVIGVPLTRFLSQLFAWQTDYVLLIIIMVTALIYFVRYLPKVAAENKAIKFNQELKLFKEKETFFVIMSSLFTFIGYGALYTFTTPYLLQLFPKINPFMSFFLLAMGMSCFVGNLVGGYVSDLIGYQKSILFGSLLQVLNTVLLFVFKGALLFSLILILMWIFTAWFIGLQVNTGINIATKNQSNFLLSINSSAIQLGMAFGSSLAALLIAIMGIQFLPLLTCLSALAVCGIYFNFKH